MSKTEVTNLLSSPTRPLPEGEKSPIMAASTHQLTPLSGRKRIFHNYVPPTPPVLTETKTEENSLEIQRYLPLSQPGIKKEEEEEEESKLGIQRTPPLFQWGIKEEKNKLGMQRTPSQFQKYVDLDYRTTWPLLDQETKPLTANPSVQRAPPLQLSKASQKAFQSACSYLAAREKNSAIFNFRIPRSGRIYLTPDQDGYQITRHISSLASGIGNSGLTALLSQLACHHLEKVRRRRWPVE